jgi:tetratricopeptide (TPR) repeat protein
MADSPRIEELRRRVQLDPASIAFAALAEEYRRLGRHEEAVATCRAGLLRHPAYLSPRVTLGRALLEMGLFDAARQELEHVLRIAPENLAAIRGLAEIHSRVKEHADSVDALAPVEPESVRNAPRAVSVTRLTPELGALAALEAFLTAIERARAAGHEGSSKTLTSADR